MTIPTFLPIISIYSLLKENMSLSATTASSGFSPSVVVEASIIFLKTNSDFSNFMEKPSRPCASSAYYKVILKSSAR